MKKFIHEWYLVMLMLLVVIIFFVAFVFILIAEFFKSLVDKLLEVTREKEKKNAEQNTVSYCAKSQRWQEWKKRIRSYGKKT